MSLPINAARNDGNGGPVLKKGPWTAAEDAVLVEYVKKNGEGNWNAVQKNTGLARCGKSCRLRWTNHLRPNLKKGAFTPEEEKLIIELHSQLGNKWARMAAQLPGRTDNEIKNYWNTRIKRRIRQGLPLYPNEATPQKEGDGGGGEGEREQNQQPAEPKTEVAGASAQEKLPAPTSFHLQTPTLFQAFNKRKASTESPFHLSCPLALPRSSSYPQLKTVGFDSSVSLFDPPITFPSPTSCLITPPLTPPTLNTPATPPLTTLQTPPTLGSSTRYKPYETPGFSLSFSTMSQSSPIRSPHAAGPSQLPSLGIGMGSSSFQFSPLAFNLSSPTSLKLHMDQMLPSNPIYSIKSELPSSQFYLPRIGRTETCVEKKPRIGQSNSGFLEDLLEEAQGLASGEKLQKQNLLNLQDKKLDASIRSIPEWDPAKSINSSKGPMNSMQENLSKLLHSMPSAIPVSKGCNANGEMQNSPKSGNSSGLSDDGLGLDAHHIAALFPTDPLPESGRISSSYNWDNLPGIC